MKTHLESRASSSPVITRAVASALTGTPFDVFSFYGWQKFALLILDHFPVSLRNRLVRWDTRQLALPPEWSGSITTEQLVAERIADYEDFEGPFDAVLIGAALGGATAHLATTLGAPFLPQPFILSFQGGSPTDEVGPHLQNALALAGPMLERNQGIQVVSHFDPIHDGWLTKDINHLRVKLLDLPAGYIRFLRERLRPGGAIVYLDCEAKWLQYEIEERHVYQIGGWGGISAEEYLQGSERIDDSLAASGSKHRGAWRLEGYPLRERAESEWGSEPGLKRAVRSFAAREGYNFVPIELPQPLDFSRLAYRAQLERCIQSGTVPQGVVIETFTQYDPTTVDQGALLPFWLIFNTSDSLEFLKKEFPNFPEGIPIFFSGLVNFSRTPDMVPWNAWKQVFQGREWINIGARPERYPEDLPALWRWPQKLRAWVQSHPSPLSLRLTPADLIRLAAEIRS